MKTTMSTKNATRDLEPETIAPDRVNITFRGKRKTVPALRINQTALVVRGKLLKTAAVMDEALSEYDTSADPRSFVDSLKNSSIRADLFTFAEKLPTTAPRHSYYHEWDNLAVIPITTFAEWWSKLSDPVQRAVKKAKRSGVTVREVPFDDNLVRGIQGIYNETPVRQGKSFWHYGKDFETVKAENSTYAERSTFLGAYLGNELIGFVRLTYAAGAAEIIQILSQMKHQDKRPTNALIAKAVEVCEQKRIAYLVYCNYVYTDPNSSLTEFKRRNGFQPVLLPRYYIPLTIAGRVALMMKLHHGIKSIFSAKLLRALVQLRSCWFKRLAARP